MPVWLSHSCVIPRVQAVLLWEGSRKVRCTEAQVKNTLGLIDWGKYPEFTRAVSDFMVRVGFAVPFCVFNRSLWEGRDSRQEKSPRI